VRVSSPHAAFAEPFPAEISNGQQMDNPVDYWWTMRALLLAMHSVKTGAEPPPSYPRLQDPRSFRSHRSRFRLFPA
jgi:hypothetical protein